MLRPRSRGQEIGDENGEQQAVDEDADKCGRKDVLRAVPPNAEQADDAEGQPNEH